MSTKLRNVAVVGFAQMPTVARDEHRMSTEMLYPVVREALAQVGVGRDAIDYQVSASTDYADGRPFGFVAALDVMGSWPTIENNSGPLRPHRSAAAPEPRPPRTRQISVTLPSAPAHALSIVKLC